YAKYPCFEGVEEVPVMSYQPQASPADVEWIDTHGDAMVAGYLITTANIQAHERTGDRRLNGRLSHDAKERIAGELSTYLERIHRIRLAANGSPPQAAAVYRDCDG